MRAFDFSRLSLMQQDALANVAFGHGGAGCSPRTLVSLERRGLIESYIETLTIFPVTRVTKWTMPLAVHIDFCAWCAQQADEEEVVV